MFNDEYIPEWITINRIWYNIFQSFSIDEITEDGGNSKRKASKVIPVDFSCDRRKLITKGQEIEFIKWLKGNNFNSLSEVDVDVLGELLKYNIVKGEYNSSVPAYFEKDIQFEFETEAAGKNIFFSHDSNYRININKGMNIGASVEVYLSNIVPVNGVIHATKVLVEYKP